MTIRLVGIDAPETSKKKNEPGQAFSQKSTKYLASLVLNKSVEVIWIAIAAVQLIDWPETDDFQLTLYAFTAFFMTALAQGYRWYTGRMAHIPMKA